MSPPLLTTLLPPLAALRSLLRPTFESLSVDKPAAVNRLSSEHYTDDDILALAALKLARTKSTSTESVTGGDSEAMPSSSDLVRHAVMEIESVEPVQ